LSICTTFDTAMMYEKREMFMKIISYELLPRHVPLPSIQQYLWAWSPWSWVHWSQCAE
jgi:hypothetical protein